MSSSQKFLSVVDLCPLIISVSFSSLLVFWLGLLYFVLPLGCTEPVPGLGRDDGGAEAALLVGGGPSLCLAGTRLGDRGG